MDASIIIAIALVIVLIVVIWFSSNRARNKEARDPPPMRVISSYSMPPPRAFPPRFVPFSPYVWDPYSNPSWMLPRRRMYSFPSLHPHRRPRHH